MIEKAAASRGKFVLVDLTPKCIRFRLTGYFDEALCQETMSAIDEWRNGRTGVIMFDDISGLSDYQVTARNQVTRWLMGHVAAYESFHVLVQTRPLAWGIDIISRVTGLKTTTYRSLDAFDAAHKRLRLGG